MVQLRGGAEAAELEDRKLILSAAGGDRAAFTELVRRRRPLVHRLAARICGPEEAEDVTQVVFLRLWRELPRLVRTGHFERWLARVTVNRAIDALRHIARRLRMLARRRQESPRPPLEESLQRGEVSRVFFAVAEELGDRQRAAFVLRELEGYETREVAAILGVTASTVRNLVHQARRGLRRALRDRFPEYAPREESDEIGTEGTSATV